TPLSDIPVTYSDLPYQVFTSTYARGTQSGYNQCNSTTQTRNQNSECQTLIVNSIFDFCLYAPGTPNSTISDTEGEGVAWCTTKEHGTRGIPPGTFTGLQVLRRNCATRTTFSLSDSSTKANVNIRPGDSNPAGYCQNTLDRIGLIYNMPNQGSTVPSKCATAMLWIFLVYTLQAGKPFPTLVPITSIL
ncbi:hypothetical protein BJV77DRAFT_952276, partial [Russula vinacea]